MKEGEYLWLTELKLSKPDFHRLICASVWQCSGHSEMGIQLGTTERITSETVFLLCLQLVNASLESLLPLTAQEEAEVKHVSSNSCFYCTGQPLEGNPGQV